MQELLPPTVGYLIGMMDFIITIAGTVVAAFVIAVGTAFWRMSGDMKLMRQLLENITRDWERRFAELSKDVDHLRDLIEQQRKWKWDEMSHAASEVKEK